MAPSRLVVLAALLVVVLAGTTGGRRLGLRVPSRAGQDPPPPPANVGSCCTNLTGTSEYQTNQFVTVTGADDGGHQVDMLTMTDMHKRVIYRQLNVTFSNFTQYSANQWVFPYEARNDSYVQVTVVDAVPGQCFAREVADPGAGSPPCFEGYVLEPVTLDWITAQVFENSTSAGGYAVAVTTDGYCVPVAAQFFIVDALANTMRLGQVTYYDQEPGFPFFPIPRSPPYASCYWLHDRDDAIPYVESAVRSIEALDSLVRSPRRS